MATKYVIEKRWNDTVWTNVYYSGSSSLAQSLVTWEQSVHYDVVQFLRVSAIPGSYNTATKRFEKDPVQPTVVEELNSTTGDRVSTGVEFLPPVNTLNLKGNSSGRVSRKFYLLPIPEGDQNGGTFGVGVAGVWFVFISDLLNRPLTKENGSTITSYAVDARVGYHQRRR